MNTSIGLIFVDFGLIGITVPYTASFMRVVPGDWFVLQTVTQTAEQVKDNPLSGQFGSVSRKWLKSPSMVDLWTFLLTLIFLDP